MPPPPHLLLQVVAPMLPPLNTIWDTAVTQGDAVKQQISGAVNALKQGQSAVNNLVGQLTTTADNGQKLTGVYDGYRYSVSRQLGMFCRGRVAAVDGLPLDRAIGRQRAFKNRPLPAAWCVMHTSESASTAPPAVALCLPQLWNNKSTSTPCTLRLCPLAPQALILPSVPHATRPPLHSSSLSSHVLDCGFQARPYILMSGVVLCHRLWWGCLPLGSASWHYWLPAWW
jgi:hypothetical protein